MRAFRFVLRLYPDDFRRAFGPAMLTTFADAASELSPATAPRRAAFVARELGGVFAGLIREWVAVATAAPFERQMTFRDPSLMRPPGMTRQEWTSRL